MNLTMGEKVRILLKRKEVTLSELSNRLGTSTQNLTNKLKRDNFSMKELRDIAEALGCTFEGYFVDNNGEKF
jgi:transcriptional regulator with XRE-family HTH domain